MFEDSGNKLKTLAKITLALCVLVFVVIGILLISAGLQINDSYSTRGQGTIFIYAGVISLILGPILSWVGCVFIYAFGSLVDNNDTLVGKIANMEGMISEEITTLKTIKKSIEDHDTSNEIKKTGDLGKTEPHQEESEEIPPEEKTTATILSSLGKKCNNRGEIQSIHNKKCDKCHKFFV